MQEIHVTYRGQYLQEGTAFSGGNCTHLLHSDESFEATVDIIPKGTVGCLYNMPEEDFEFNYILKGELELCGLNEKIRLRPGDTFSYYLLTRNYIFRTFADTEMLTVKKTPCYHAAEASVERLNEVLQQLQQVDGDTLDHCERVKGLSMGIAYALSYDQSKLLDLFYAAKFHDVGKSKIPTDILLKPGRLTEEEFQIMKKHGDYTYQMILENYGESVARIALEHHERLDGTGYPNGLKGDEISLPARIICVADAYDAMTVTRPYRNALPKNVAIAELRRCENTQFDPKVVAALEQHLSDLDA